MKKFFSAALILVLMAGCKNQQETYQQDLTGSWTVYKYLLNNVDQTQQFQNQYTNYVITFTSNTFTESFHNSTDTSTNTGTYSFTQNYQQLVLQQQVPYVLDSVVRDSTLTRTYTIFNLTSASVQLRNDTSQLYMSKKQ